MDAGVLIPIMGILLVMIPVAGLTLGLTVRHAVRPMVEMIVSALRESRAGMEAEGMAARLALLQEEVEGLTHEVRELKAAQDFDRKLLGAEREDRR